MSAAKEHYRIGDSRMARWRTNRTTRNPEHHFTGTRPDRILEAPCHQTSFTDTLRESIDLSHDGSVFTDQ